MSQSAALPIAWISLRILSVVNWVCGGLLLALLWVSFRYEGFLWKAMGVGGIAATPDGVAGLRAVIAVGIISVAIASVVLRELTRIVETVRAGDAFTIENAGRLQMIAWALVALEILHIAVMAIGSAISTNANHLRLGGDLSLTNWLAVVLLFVLAGVFREGARMREDLEGTV